MGNKWAELLRETIAGRLGEVGRLEDELARASAAESAAKAALIEATSSHKTEVEGLQSELTNAHASLAHAQQRLAAAEEEKESLLQEREVCSIIRACLM